VKALERESKEAMSWLFGQTFIPGSPGKSPEAVPMWGDGSAASSTHCQPADRRLVEHEDFWARSCLQRQLQPMNQPCAAPGRSV